MSKSNSSGGERSGKNEKQQKIAVRHIDSNGSSSSSLIKHTDNNSSSSSSSIKHNENNGSSSSSTTNERRKRNKKKNENEKVNDPILSYLPFRVRNYVVHYHDDFFISPYFDPNLIIELMYEGFLPIATCSGASPHSSSGPTHYLLPKLHKQRCVLFFPNLHVSKSPRRKSRDYILKVNSDFDGVVQGCHNQHGVAWLYPPMVQALKCINLNHECTKVKVYSIELYKKILVESEGEGEKDNLKIKSSKSDSSSEEKQYTYILEAGELGYTVNNKIYTSLTGFYNQSGTGTIQLLALAGLLKSLEYELWDFGMEMEYKMNLGASCLDRQEFITEFHKLRSAVKVRDSARRCTSFDTASENESGYEAKALIDVFK